MFSFVETRLFTKLVLDYLADDDYAALQEALMVDPDAGPVIPGSGGVRKLGGSGSGKAGWVSDHLLRAPHPRRHLDVDDVSEERRGEHPSARAATDS